MIVDSSISSNIQEVRQVQ